MVARRSNGGRRQAKSRRLEDRLEKRCGEEKNILEERQLIICTIDNGEVSSVHYDMDSAVIDKGLSVK